MYCAKLLKMCYWAGMRPSNAKGAFVEVNHSKLKAILAARPKDHLALQVSYCIII